MFVLDNSIGSFVLVKEHLKIPMSNKIYSINEAYGPVPGRVSRLPRVGYENGYTSRYIGSMVADMHRTLIKGGCSSIPRRVIGRRQVRYLYKRCPGMLIEQAGGRSITDAGTRLRCQATITARTNSRRDGFLEEVQHVERFRTKTDFIFPEYQTTKVQLR